MSVTYEQFLEANNKIKKNYGGLFLKYVPKIAKVDSEHGLVFMQDRSEITIENLVKMVIAGNGCVSNPSILSNWPNFKKN